MNNINRLIKSEANYLLKELKLYSLLNHFIDSNDIYLTGSYTLEVMAWRDLDLYIDIKDVSQNDVYSIVKEIIDDYKPVWLETKDTHNDNSGCPKGYFVGFETYAVSSSDLWNIDIWFTNIDYINHHLNYMADIKDKLNDEKRRKIIDMKRQFIETGEYQNKYYSVDVYNKVLNLKGKKTISQ